MRSCGLLTSLHANRLQAPAQSANVLSRLEKREYAMPENKLSILRQPCQNWRNRSQIWGRETAAWKHRTSGLREALR